MTYFRPSTCLSRPREGFYTSELPTPRGWPLRTFLPTGYEPNYPYPLLVFLHGHASSEEEVLRLAPRLSRRNHICIALRGPRRLDPQANGRPAFAWDTDGQTDDAQVEDYVFRAVEQTRRHYHVHSERIYLAGFCEGAIPAYRLAMAHPQRFAGLVSLNGSMPRHNRPLLRLSELRGLRVLIAHGIANNAVPLSLAREDFRLLYTAGLDVRMHTYPSTHRIVPEMLRDLDRWVIEYINEEHDQFRE